MLKPCGRLKMILTTPIGYEPVGVVVESVYHFTALGANPLSASLVWVTCQTATTITGAR